MVKALRRYADLSSRRHPYVRRGCSCLVKLPYLGSCGTSWRELPKLPTVPVRTRPPDGTSIPPLPKVSAHLFRTNDISFASCLACFYQMRRGTRYSLSYHKLSVYLHLSPLSHFKLHTRPSCCRSDTDRREPSSWTKEFKIPRPSEFHIRGKRRGEMRGLAWSIKT